VVVAIASLIPTSPASAASRATPGRKTTRPLATSRSYVAFFRAWSWATAPSDADTPTRLMKRRMRSFPPATRSSPR